MVNILYGNFPQAQITLGKNANAQEEEAELSYLAEGNANVVYAFKPFGKTRELPPALGGKLLRLRKNKPFIQPTRAQIATYQQRFMPLFHPNNLVEHVLINIDRGVFTALNKDLEHLELSGRRLEQRRGDRLAANEDYGLMITDMTPQIGECLVEIKPKWLQQSPDAPSDAIRCRTCALRTQRSAAKARGTIVPRPGVFCPLSLVDTDLSERCKAFEPIVRSQMVGLSEGVVKSIAKFLAEEGYRILRDLREHQARLDGSGLLNSTARDISDDYLKAMTLRDCLLFVKGSLNDFANTAEIRLADLDFKQAHPDKVQKWESTERELIQGGWYTSGLETLCVLSRRPRGKT